MKNITIGIDPDSKCHGVAIYFEGKIERLESWDLMRIYHYTKRRVDLGFTVDFHIENVCANNATFKKQHVKNTRAETAISRSLGKCQQSQIELERALSHLEVKITHHPISKHWKDSKTGKKFLLDKTGWDGKSNEDTRSAAYFGWLGVQ